ncbi:Protein of unknown function (DUF1415) [Seminavis robusta]|uniref:Uncharacterized protein n=1 Tax=Seminavis robusta TaxID=568900 RepID=A0A9N8HWF8_9STRA|nr:Protein of unknown function (DUF1415) [Seminavis robusta]|eukprot:Sro1969_g308470.1 Protein of unknown function (DUF1415) (571) ;mRNA; f:6991-8783
MGLTSQRMMVPFVAFSFALPSVSAFLVSPSRLKTATTTQPTQSLVNTHYLNGLSGTSDKFFFAASAKEDEENSGTEEEDNENEWHPRDSAETTPQLLKAIWDQIARGNAMVKGDEETVLYPNMEDKLNTPQFFNILLGHLDSCKDVCDYYGITTVLVPYRKEGGRIVGFTVKSYRNPDKDYDSFEFDYDPFWDDGTDFEKLYDGIDDELETETKKKLNLPEIVDKIPDDDDKIIDVTKVWVAKIMSDMGICPFTNGAEMAGLPMGPVFYTVDRATAFENMYARYWKEVVRIEQESEKEISTTLLIAPEFYIDNVELFESFSNTLTQPLTALGVEDLLQLVFFHPQWSFRDGGARAGGGEAANYARRSPWPMINILRTKQVRAAQKGIPTGLVYKQNEKTLGAVGSHQLETMLRLRNWDEIADVKVDRREMDALRVAKEFQESGNVKVEDQSFANDATPAANKVESSQVEQGDLVKVVQDALNKRLGKSGEPMVALSGPETSATAMAVDFLMKELERIEQTGPATTQSGQDAQKMAAARAALLEDFQDSEDEETGDEEMSALFGKSGIAEA